MERWVEYNDRFFNMAQVANFRVWKSEPIRVEAYLTIHSGDSDGISADDVFIGRFDTEEQAKEVVRAIIRGDYDVPMNAEPTDAQASASVEDVQKAIEEDGEIPF